MTAVLWVTIVVAFIAAGSSIISARISAKAERNTRPVSNGFAAGVIAQLGEMHETLAEVRTQLAAHIEHHEGRYRRGA